MLIFPALLPLGIGLYLIGYKFAGVMVMTYGSLTWIIFWYYALSRGCYQSCCTNWCIPICPDEEEKTKIRLEEEYQNTIIEMQLEVIRIEERSKEIKIQDFIRKHGNPKNES